MKPLERTLAIVACLFLIVQTVRHTYLLWLEPRDSVLDKYDLPMKDEIAAASSIEVLLARYDPIRKQADHLKAERRAADPDEGFSSEEEPFRSEASLREAISSWEERAKEIHTLCFYWFVGLLLVVIGLFAYLRMNRWSGVTLLIAGFAEIVYWTSPTFLGPVIKEFDRLLVYKLVLSAVSLLLLGLVIRSMGVFREAKRQPE